MTIAGIAAVVIAVILAAVLRFWASLGDFWMDEVLSWVLATQQKSPLHVFTRVHHDNNHYVNTLILYAIGNDAPLYLYRLPAVIAGIGAVLLSGLVARSWGRVAAVTATLITGCSFLLIQYSSEARGYAYLLFFTMASFAVLQKSLEHPRAVWDVLFACFAVLGFLSHLSFGFAYLALISWSLWRICFARDGRLPRRYVVPLIFQILVPAAVLVVVYLVDLRYLNREGGEVAPVWSVISQATSAAFGGPLEGPATVVVALAIMTMAAAALALLFRQGIDSWVPLLMGIFVAPAIILLIFRPQWPYPRYFLICALFLQLLISWFLDWVYHRPHGKIAYLLIISAILCGNAFLTARLIQYGRGDYQGAVRYIVEHTRGQKIQVASDNDFRNYLVFAFFFVRNGNSERLEYFNWGSWPAEGPEWVVIHNFAQRFAPFDSFNDQQGNTYSFAALFPYAGLSGFNWALYHNRNRAAGDNR